ncbi:hypothetical protein Ppb6_02767 [Photorhabdus australis subsp. thailandensis]|uniref:Uncharacterized protein n=1 Tax=Photorhabdus australis subsp. thailandensis TaxID=2805096 RepID=A0A1C0U248_9GAMM|nr:hypothetical protein Ppb6_02767 [Photorhabdus australis subsp. thailandensis]
MSQKNDFKAFSIKNGASQLMKNQRAQKLKKKGPAYITYQIF